MPVKQEELWTPQSHPGLYLVTTNSSINRNGELVMGRGAALQATKRIPGIAKEAAQKILEWRKKSGRHEYLLLIIREPRPLEGRYGFGIFQVKTIWNAPADLHLISTSLNVLRTYAYGRPELSIRMNYPGIGYGHLSRKAVGTVLEPNLKQGIHPAIPKNVTVCFKEETTQWQN